MPYDRFVITHLDPAADYGFVRQLESSEGVVSKWPIGFTLSGVAEALYAPDGTIRGIRIPHSAILAHMPAIGDELLGVIATDGSDGVAFDAQNLMFLRNWFYADQRNIFKDTDLEPDDSDDDDVYTGSGEEDDSYGQFEDPDDDGYIDDPDDLAEIEHGRKHEMYNS